MLDTNAKRLLAYLADAIKRINIGKPETYLGYGEVINNLNLTPPHMGETAGDCLKRQGLLTLAQWTKEQKMPAITGIIVNKTKGSLGYCQPGQGYFLLFGKNVEDYDWWNEEIRYAKNYDWSPHVEAFNRGKSDTLIDAFNLVALNYANALTVPLKNHTLAAHKRLLEAETSWTVKAIDDGKQQNVPDILVILGRKAVLIECKTTTKSPPLVKKEEAFAVLQKAVDYDKEMDRVTLGKPEFDEHSKKKAQAAKDISLVEHSTFMEGMLRVLAGVITPMDFLHWISAPGLVEISRLSGIQTYEVGR